MLRQMQNGAISTISNLPGTATLRIKLGFAGFFGTVFTCLNGIRFAEANQMRASVLWGKGTPYFEASRGANAWATYFNTETFDFSNGRFSNGLKLPYRPGAHDFIPYQGLSVRESVGRAMRTWCQPLPELAATISEYAETHFGATPMLGVHVRLTDVAAGAEGRMTVTLSSFFLPVDEWLLEYPNGRIYLATDDQSVVETFVRRYGSIVLYQDCIRSEDGSSIHGHYDAGVAGSPYQKGREVMIDALLIARCKHLIRTHSRVTAFSLCWNPNLTYRDLEREILGVDRTPWLHV
jgi:hypothetical protein